MTQPKAVAYDFAAASDLSAKCRQLHDKIAWLVRVRASGVATYLNDRPDSWTGGKREAFDGDHGREQRALDSLAHQALTLMAHVDTATENATAMARKILFADSDK
ncbi:hypothetical protein [Streptomyces sp. NPDC020983]|uniref:hypothetical protein n=1 Tax=Streptomyces sp. NPDC020983 TaxID=3365106 RepID=UPI0037B6CA9B